MRRLVGCFATALVAALAVAGPAGAWSWPLHGEVLRPFSLGADAYAPGQHRGIDVGGSANEDVLAPVDGTVTFVGVVPTHGRVVALQTAEGLSVTMAHLGSALVARGTTVVEGDVVGSAGSSGESEHAVPYVHLGVRRAGVAEGYLDPLRFLPPRVVDGFDPPPAQPVVAPGVAPAAGTEEVPPAASATPEPTVVSPSIPSGRPASTPDRVGTTLGATVGPEGSTRSVAPVVPSHRSAPAANGATHAATASATAPPLVGSIEQDRGPVMVSVESVDSPGVDAVRHAHRPMRTLATPTADAAPRIERLGRPAQGPCGSMEAHRVLDSTMPLEPVRTDSGRHDVPEPAIVAARAGLDIRAGWPLLLAGAACALLLTVAAGRAATVRLGGATGTRTLGRHGAQEDPRRRRLAVRQRPAPHRPRRRVRRALRRLQPATCGWPATTC